MEKENKKNSEIKEDEKDPEVQEGEDKGEKNGEKISEMPVPAKPAEKKAEPKKAKKGRQRLSITVIRITANYVNPHNKLVEEVKKAENEADEKNGNWHKSI